MMKKNIALLLLFLCAVTAANAKLKLPALVGSNMVLQQNTNVKFWGWASAGATVTVKPSWCPAVRAKADKDGNWIVSVKTPLASFEKRSIAISEGSDAVKLDNVLIGEVWLCSGQSNMEIPVQGGKDCPIEHSQQIIVESAQYPDIRLFTVRLNGGDEKKDDVTGSWQQASPLLVKKFSAVGYLFGMNLQKALHVPVGIIASSCGGTWIEAWFSADAQRKISDFDPTTYRRKGGNGANTIESLYNGMIWPVHNYAVKGFCWYQGETNEGYSAHYAEKMAALINNWREIWGGDKKPFYYVEIAPCENGETNLNSALVREQQARVMSMTENTGMVCTNDLIYDYERGNVHPSQKEAIGQRLAYWALSKDYGYGDAIKVIGPTFKSMEVESNGEVKVSFNGGDYGFIIKGDIKGFELAGADGVFKPAHAVRRRPDATVLYVSSYDVGKPVAVRYNFKNYAPGSLWDAFGQPVVPFRSDDYPIAIMKQNYSAQ